MDNFSTIWNVFAVVALGLVGVFIVLSAATSGRFSRLAPLMRRMEGTRMMRMMQHLGLSPTVYLYEEHSADIKHHLRNCAACRDVDVCDKVLAREEHGTAPYAFCPNKEVMGERMRQATLR